MKIFISWSGDKGETAAQSLRDWLPYVIPDIQPWISSADIQPGARWAVEIGHQLEQSRYGIICITRESLGAQWLLFEAGALAKSLEAGRVIPYLIDVEIDDLEGPLGQFQAIPADKLSTWELVIALNKDCGNKDVPERRLRDMFETFWPRLDGPLKRLRYKQTRKLPKNDSRSNLHRTLENIEEGLAENTEALRVLAAFTAPEANLHKAEFRLLVECIFGFFNHINNPRIHSGCLRRGREIRDAAVRVLGLANVSIDGEIKSMLEDIEEKDSDLRARRKLVDTPGKI